MPAPTSRKVPPEVAATRARLAALTARGASPDRIAAARRDLTAEQIASEHARLRSRAAELAAQAPPLTATQRARLAVLLRPGDAS